MDFLIHLRQDKGLSVSAVKGYCSALNSVLALKGRDLAASREITTLLRSFARSVNPVELRPPAWDVSLVLQSLMGAPYEPLRTCEERFLAQKTLFLLALASAKRIGELHALSYRVSHTRDWGEVSFAFVTGFVAKTQDPSSLAPRFESFSIGISHCFKTLDYYLILMCMHLEFPNNNFLLIMFLLKYSNTNQCFFLYIQMLINVSSLFNWPMTHKDVDFNNKPISLVLGQLGV